MTEIFSPRKEHIAAEAYVSIGNLYQNKSVYELMLERFLYKDNRR